MLEEQYERSEVRSVVTDPLRVENVPSDQLWRAAVLAARQAAFAAAELRRALDEDTVAPPPPPRPIEVSATPQVEAAPLVA
jgi:hypothetical protein